MMGTGFSWRLGVLLGIAGLQVSCTAISDLGRFKVADGGSSSMGRDAAAAGDASTTNDGGAGSSDGGNSDASVDGGGPKIGCDNPATIC
ncbi:MAG TPA: hypothetical protein VHM19_11395, partial [Polyangiales bacterium]|nr:hypothetical protein [Polyangiales bacterium]